MASPPILHIWHEQTLMLKLHCTGSLAKLVHLNHFSCVAWAVCYKWSFISLALICQRRAASNKDCDTCDTSNMSPPTAHWQQRGPSSEQRPLMAAVLGSAQQVCHCISTPLNGPLSFRLTRWTMVRKSPFTHTRTMRHGGCFCAATLCRNTAT